MDTDMSELGTRVRRRAPLRLAAIVAGVLVLMVSVATTAWALGGGKQRGYSGAASYQMTLRSGEHQQVTLLNVGSVSLWANCEAGPDPGQPDRLGTFFGFGIRNNGAQPVLIAWSGELGDTTGPQYRLLGNDESDPWFGAGQGATFSTPNVGNVTPFSIMSQSGPSVTGLASMWLSAGGTLDQTASCVFSVQARG